VKDSQSFGAPMSNPADACTHCAGTTPRGPPLYTYKFYCCNTMSES
jgi:hypothetical protein